jgi:hypothetical protein
MDGCMYVCVCARAEVWAARKSNRLSHPRHSFSFSLARALARLYLNESVLPLVVLIDIQNRASAVLLHA